MKLKSVLTLAVVLGLALALTLSGQQTYSNSGSVHRFWVGVVPTSTTVVAAGTVYLRYATFSTAGGAGTVTLSDRGADCAGSPCPFADTLPIAANATYNMDFGSAGVGTIAPSGISVIATGTVRAHIYYATGIQ